MKTSRRQFIGAATAALAFASGPASAWKKGQARLPVTWNALTTNGGGLSPGLSVSDDGTPVCYTDTAGAYVFDAGTWRQIGASQNNPNPNLAPYSGYRDLGGFADCQIAPDDSNYIYYLSADPWFNNRVGRAFLSKSTDKGLTANVTSYPQNTGVDGSGILILGSNNDTFKRVQCKIGVDPNNKNVVYVTYPGGQAKVTFDGGTTFSDVPSLPVGTVTSIGACCWQFDRSSGTTTVNGQTVTATIYCAVYGSGIWQSTNGGVSFSRISSTVGALAPGYCSISGDGVYFISDLQTNSASFTGSISGTTLTASSVTGTINPGNPLTGASVTAGTYIVAQISGTPGGAGDYTVSTSQTRSGSMTIASASYSTVNRYQSAAWSVIWQMGVPGTRTGINIAAHPTVAGTVCAMISGGTPHFLASSDYGATWTRTNKTSETITPSTDAPWYTNQLADSSFTVSNQQMMFDRSTPGKLYLNYGQGVVVGTITVGAAPTWAGVTKGLEQTVCPGTWHESGSSVLQVVNDLLMFQHTNPSGLQTPPNNLINNTTFLLKQGWCGAIDSYNPQNQVIAGWNTLNGTSANYYTTDGGTTWNLMANTPPTVLVQSTYSSIKIANGVILWAFGVNGQSTYMYRSTDFGATAWTALGSGNFSNGADFPATGPQGWASPANSPKHTVAFDRVNSSLVLAYNILVQTPAIKGLYVSTDAGQNFTYQGSTKDPSPGTGIGFLDIKSVPGITGKWFATTGYNSTQPPPDTGARASLYMLDWDGATITLTQISAIKEANYIGFGAAGPSGIASLYVAGFYRGTYGIWMSPDLGVTWFLLWSTTYGVWPIRNDAVYGVDGDKDVFGRVYISFRGSGTAYSTLVT